MAIKNFANNTQELESQELEFCLVGSASGLIWGDKGQPKYLQLQTESGLHRIKLAKSLRRSPQIHHLSFPCSLQVTGTRKLDPRKGQQKLKAHHLSITPPHPESVNLCAPRPTQSPQATAQHPSLRSKILVCQKSSCRKRGAQNVCRALQENLRQRGLSEQVKVVETGCMKDCKAGPHVVVMPTRQRYTHSAPSSVAKILDQHFPK